MFLLGEKSCKTWASCPLRLQRGLTIKRKRRAKEECFTLTSFSQAPSHPPSLRFLGAAAPNFGANAGRSAKTSEEIQVRC